MVSGGDRGAGIRVFHGGSQAYAYSNRLDPEALREAARAAASAVRGGGRPIPVVDLGRTPTHRHAVESPAG